MHPHSKRRGYRTKGKSIRLLNQFLLIKRVTSVCVYIYIILVEVMALWVYACQNVLKYTFQINMCGLLHVNYTSKKLIDTPHIQTYTNTHMSFIHRYTIIREIFTALKISCALYIHPFPLPSPISSPWQSLIFLLSL